MTERKKEAVVTFLEMAASGKVREAFANYTGSGFKHHNPFYEGSAEALMAGMEENARQFPNKTLAVQRVIAEGDLVVVHSHIKLEPTQSGIVTVHIFRFEKERIVELWDIGQVLPENSVNQEGMF